METPDYCVWPSRSKWFDVGYDLLTLANDCLADTPLGSPKDIYMDTDQPDFDCCDFLSVHMQVIRPIQPQTGPFPEENFDPLQQCHDFHWVPRYEITLGRPCRPIMAGNRAVPPAPKDRTEYARKIYHDAETLPCCILSKLGEGYPLAGLRFDEDPAAIFPQQVYVESFSVCTRIRFRIMFDFNTCCDPEGLGYDDAEWGQRKTGTPGPIGPTSALSPLPSAAMLDLVRNKVGS